MLSEAQAPGTGNFIFGIKRAEPFISQALIVKFKTTYILKIINLIPKSLFNDDWLKVIRIKKVQNGGFSWKMSGNTGSGQHPPAPRTSSPYIQPPLTPLPFQTLYLSKGPANSLHFLAWSINQRALQYCTFWHIKPKITKVKMHGARYGIKNDWLVFDFR